MVKVTAKWVRKMFPFFRRLFLQARDTAFWKCADLLGTSGSSLCRRIPGMIWVKVTFRDFSAELSSLSVLLCKHGAERVLENLCSELQHSIADLGRTLQSWELYGDFAVQILQSTGAGIFRSVWLFLAAPTSATSCVLGLD